MSDTVLAEMADRRNPLQPARRLALFADRLEWREDATLVRRIALEQVRQVRLSVEMAGQQTQVVCRVTGPAGEIVFGSRRATSPGVWADNALEFRGFLVDLHAALRPHFSQIGFVEGQSMGFRVIMSGIGAVLAILGVMFAGWMMLIEASAMLAVAALPFVAIGGYLAWLFRPGFPVPYDPEGLIERFRAAMETDAG